MAERWATFDCYGTLVDWNGGIRAELEGLFGVEHADRLLTRYHELEPEVQASQPASSYREVLTIALERLAQEEGLTLPEGEASALARSLPSWPVFGDAPAALAEARSRGWRLAILSNTDRDLIDASVDAIGVPFDEAIVAGEIGSYKPGRRHWQVFRATTSADPAGHVHVAQSLYHDIAPAGELGIPCIWINRLGEPEDARPQRTLTSLTGLADALDELAPRMSKLLRAPTEHDIADVVRLMSEHWPEPANEDLVRRSWSSPDFELEHDARVDGASYVDVEALGEGRVWIDARGRPSAAILDWAETRAREKGTRLLAGGWSSNEPLLEALERRGFRIVRHSHRMRINLDDPTPEPVWPAGIEVRSFRPGDERAFYDAHQETFEDSWEPIEESYDEWAHWQLESHAFVPELWFLAIEDGEPAGFALCHPHSGDPECGWVRILGVRRPWRKRGLGRALLLQAFAEFRKRGLRRAGLGVDAESVTGANRLYEQAGMHVAARFDIYEKAVE